MGERENSIEAFEKAIKLGAGGIETDIRITLDREVIVHHDGILKINGERVAIAKNPLKTIFQSDKNILTLAELFKYIEQKNISFFLELKSPSEVLVDKIAEEIGNRNLWSRVHVIGFSVIIKTALKMQAKYPKLRVIPFLSLPILTFVRPPKMTYGVFLGWIEEWPWSRFAFQKMISPQRLKKLKNRYDAKGFKVMAGVINNKEGIEYFKNAGITDVVTDEIELAKKILR